MPGSRVYMNCRTLAVPLTGVQRCVREWAKRLEGRVQGVQPGRPLGGTAGHLWEQVVLPGRVRTGVLWSPGNSGPLAVRHQVVTVHDVVPLDHPEWLNPRFAAWYRFLTPRLLKRCARVVAVSRFTKERILYHTGIPDDKVTVVHNGVDARFSPRPEDEIRAAKKALGIECQSYVLSVSSLEPRKNLPRLLEAWRALEGEMPPEVWLVVAGARGAARVFQGVDLGPLPPRVILTDRVPDTYLPALYSGAIAFAYPSVYEGFGLPPLEAMACGVPSVVGNRTALPEVVGEAALLVEPESVEEIAEGIRRLLGDPELRAALRERGLRQAGRFSWEASAAGVWSVLEEVAARDR